jgi:chromosome segregation ATPase
MPETRPDGPRFLHETDPSKADTTATVDVMDVLARLADRTEELAEAKVRQKHAEATLRRKTREMNTERKAHREACKRLEADCRDLGAEFGQVAAQCRELEAEIARERKARTALEVDLKRAQRGVAALQHHLQVAWAQLQQDRSAALQHELQGAWAQLQPGRTEGGQRSWWSRLGS